ncbi:epimerase [Flavobacterium noncentrifugens]|uniref:Nucleoside-diphosphate-sugar epimerase n=1 Tax=Flavobacterium noncentrifugens TaxID=1128970 RepID=A0A1G8T7T6_9FLAO|nr:SDR family oxidoreductase [Flavobacterium noncentrifugens]GEP50121.1 epimerase [Flavobacterium noncentrifugens]SDJ37612.1 Nucleoside-diphosphate-sugar epimerase [Flavobacterium noncentrifugens]
MTKISILGCGWLGFPLAKALISKNFEVYGSTTSESQLALLQNFGIEPFLISVSESGISGNVSDFLNSNILIVDIPPKLRGLEKENFVSKIQNLIYRIESSTIQKVLFISSTSVYADENAIITEEKIPNPDTESGRQLYESEQLLQKNKNFKTTILRFGGLIGDDRHPIKFLAGRENLENPDGPINLIHQKDCIGIILKIIKNEIWNETFNAATPFHPTRENYYTEKAKSENLPEPKFNHEKISVGKTIDSQKLQEILSYDFTFKKL